MYGLRDTHLCPPVLSRAQYTTGTQNMLTRMGGYESLNPLAYLNIYFLEALQSTGIALSFPPNFNIKLILDLDEVNYITDKRQIFVDDDYNKDQESSHENAVVLAPHDFVLYQFR